MHYQIYSVCGSFIYTGLEDEIDIIGANIQQIFVRQEPITKQDEYESITSKSSESYTLNR